MAEEMQETLATAAQLRPLIALLEDESPVVRNALRERFTAWLPHLPEMLQTSGVELSTEQEQQLEAILEPGRREALLAHCGQWHWMPQADQQLEEGLDQLCCHLNGWRTTRGELSRRLDSLAEAAMKECGRVDLYELSQWLFTPQRDQARLRGNGRHFYSSQNSNLIAVIESGLGNPISLCCIYRLVGQRFGLQIGGCNFPGHFLASVIYGGQRWLVDCYNRGRFMLAEDVARHHPAANPALADVVRRDAEVDQILLRCLRNLDEACERSGSEALRPLLRQLVLSLMGGCP